MKKEREEQIKQQDQTWQMDLCKNEIAQFNSVKNLLKNFSFSAYNKSIVVPEITIHVMEEMRQERKIKLVL